MKEVYSFIVAPKKSQSYNYERKICWTSSSFDTQSIHFVHCCELFLPDHVVLLHYHVVVLPDHVVGDLCTVSC